MTKHGRILAFGSAAVLVVAGIVGAAVVAGTAGQLLAIVLISIGFVLATSLVFLEAGLSEDRERAREAKQPRPGRLRRRRRLDRIRGRPRRLR